MLDEAGEAVRVCATCEALILPLYAATKRAFGPSDL
jgi:hypothetical protein